MGIFRPSRVAVWKQYCADIGAVYFPEGILNRDHIDVKVNEWTVYLDSYVESAGITFINYTRLRSPCRNPAEIEFNIDRRSLLNKLTESLNAKSIRIGVPEFDDAFNVTGSDKQLIKQLLQDNDLRTQIENQPHIHINVRETHGTYGPTLPEDCDELCVRVTGAITDTSRLNDLLKLHDTLLNHIKALKKPE